MIVQQYRSIAIGFHDRWYEAIKIMLEKENEQVGKVKGVGVGGKLGRLQGEPR